MSVEERCEEGALVWSWIAADEGELSSGGDMSERMKCSAMLPRIARP